MEIINEVNSFVNDIVWGPIMIALLLGTGIFLSVRLKFPQLSRIKDIRKVTLGRMKEDHRRQTEHGTIASAKAGLASIACVVGTGNITGVATAVATGGPGALLWMWLSAFFGMATKFAEIALGLYYREKNERGEYIGGAMFYIYKGLKSKWMAYFFCIMAIFSYMVCGAIVDTNSIVLGIQAQWHVPPLASGIVMAFLTAIVILGGITRIGDVCEWLTPLMSLIYIFVGGIIVILHFPQLPHAFATIFTGAFTPQGAAGGFAGATVMQIMTVGLARGLNSNEAGMGSSPTLNCSADVDYIENQGFWGIVEVFLDTMIINTVTGLVIVLSGKWVTGISGTELAMHAFSTFMPGHIGNYFILISTFLFGYSCLITSSFLCEVSGEFIWGKKAVLPVRWIWIAFIVVGSIGGLEFVWDLADTANGLMAIPNLIALLLLSGTLVRIYKEKIPTGGKIKDEDANL